MDGFENAVLSLHKRWERQTSGRPCLHVDTASHLADACCQLAGMCAPGEEDDTLRALFGTGGTETFANSVEDSICELIPALL